MYTNSWFVIFFCEGSQLADATTWSRWFGRLLHATFANGTYPVRYPPIAPRYRRLIPAQLGKRQEVQCPSSSVHLVGAQRWCVNISQARHWSPMFDVSAHLNWISETLLKSLDAVPSSFDVEIRVFITGSDSGTPASQQPTLRYGDTPEAPVLDEKEKEIVMAEATSPRSPSNALPTTLGRPDLPRLLKEEIDHTTGPVSVDGEPWPLECCQRNL